MTLVSDPLQRFARAVSSALGRNSALIKTLRPAYESTLRCIHRNRGIPWSINGVPFRIDPRYRQLMVQNWDSEVAAFLRERVRPGALCLDVGANAGIYVLQFCHWSAPDGRVIAFEPNPIAREILKRHVRMNGFEECVEIVPLAISDREGEAEFHFTGASGMSRLGRANSVLAAVDEVSTVTTTTLDAFCGQRGVRPDWLLIDIEGYELHALRAARSLLKHCPKLQLIVEMHPSLWPSAKTAAYEWHEFIRDKGLHPVPLMGQTDPLEEGGSIYLERQ